MKLLGVMLCLLGLCFGVMALSITGIYSLVSPVGLPCHSMSYDGILDIRNRFREKEAFFLSNDFSIQGAIEGNGKSILLAGGTGRYHGPFPLTMFDRLPSGSSMSLEFCGLAIVRVKLDDHEIFIRTQKNADDNRMKNVLRWGGSAILGFFAAILGGWLARRTSDS
ncbi:hypothetical protein C7405_10128 [Paraburkholderia caballeronis]|nr:hypothetical protein C7405_10128 [Paraburkholderia caballeronis]